MCKKNIPNYLTILRICLIPLIVFALYFDSRFAHIVAEILFITACITDAMDGYIARKFHIVSDFGRIFDPIADKLLVVSIIMMLVNNHKVSPIPCLLILAREFFVSGLREFLAYKKVTIHVSSISKVKTVMQMIALNILVIGSKGLGISYIDLIGQVMLWIAAILTIISAIQYLIKSKKYFSLSD